MSNSTELFRFVSQKPIQQIPDNLTDSKTVLCYLKDTLESNRSLFYQQLLDFRELPDAYQKIKTAARIHIDEILNAAYEGHRSGNFCDHIIQSLHCSIWKYAQIFAIEKYSYKSYMEVFNLIQRLMLEIYKVHNEAKKISDFIHYDQYRQDRGKLGDALIAVSIDSERFHKNSDHLVQTIRFMGVIEKMAELEASVDKGLPLDADFDFGFRNILKAIVVLPPTLFPLPKQPDSKIKTRTTTVDHSNDIQNIWLNLRSTLKEINELKENNALAFVPSPENTENGNNDFSQIWKPWILTNESVEKISISSKATLEKIGIDMKAVPFPDIIAKLEKEIAQTALKIYKATTPEKIMRHGGTSLIIKPSENVNNKAGLSQTGLDDIGLVHYLGSADLLKVEQTLIRYELGEIAHVENILKGEYKERFHRRARIVEEETSTETEREESTERDLESTTRFELKNETAETLKEDHKLDVAVSTSGEYGPAFKWSANANYGYTNSKEQSKKASSSYAKDVIERSKSKLVEKLKETRKTKTREEFEEKNTHGFDNKNGAGHISGIYRWIDKIYETQVVNYGNRSLLEFIIPEPAAFYLYAIKNKPASIAKPELPMTIKDEENIKYGLPVSESIEGAITLSPEMITRENYLIWCAKYGVLDFSPPPQEFTSVFYSAQKKKPDGENYITNLESISIPEGYKPFRFYSKLFYPYSEVGTIKLMGGLSHGPEFYSPGDGTSSSANFGIDQPYFYSPSIEEWEKSLIDNKIPFSYYATFGEFIIHCYYLCELKPDCFFKWQLEIYSAIQNAYQVLRYDYEEKLAAIAVQENNQSFGNPPAMNRQIEQNELKKSIVSFLHKEKFGGFEDLESDEYGTPLFNFGKAEKDTRIVQFLEQAFEWNNMTYRLYPYFWGEKGQDSSEWVGKLTQIRDVDPQFESFLKSGAARVVLPVRPGYEDALVYYDLNKVPWPGNDPPQVGDPLYVSLVNEIMEEQGINFEKSEGVLSVKKGMDVVVGLGTDFVPGPNGDEDREIIIEGQSYRIISVQSPYQLTLNIPYNGETNEKARYNIGVKYVSQPWEVRIPTTLVMLQEGSSLPNWKQPVASENGQKEGNQDSDKESNIFIRIRGCIQEFFRKIFEQNPKK